jgi:hypothetical protein
MSTPTPTDRIARIDQVRHALLDLHKSMIDAQRIVYERQHGRIGTTSEFLGLVLEHPQFEWIRELSALIAQLDEWREDIDQASDHELEDILAMLRSLMQRDGPNAAFTQRYWEMIDATPEVLVSHVKLWRMIERRSGELRR